ncbi:MAG: type II toxin-antitoxin system Phd/YefM family antitoxin [Steroidobacteraceae bacterium]|nr:type II toxin-antitoxin system Phd/YefM family antitoxin [Deltaproteobacteria bacterium]
MPHIHPLSELKSHLDQIVDICRKDNQPVYLTRKGHGELVLMSLAGYEQIQAKLKRYEEIESEMELLCVREAEARYAEIEAGNVTCRPLEDSVRDARGKLK